MGSGLSSSRRMRDLDHPFRKRLVDLSRNHDGAGLEHPGEEHPFVDAGRAFRFFRFVLHVHTIDYNKKIPGECHWAG